MGTPKTRHLALGTAALAVAVVGFAVAGPLTSPGVPAPPAAATTSRSTSAAPTPSVSPSAGPRPLPDVAVPRARPPGVRVAGDDLYATSVEAAQAAFPGKADAPVVYLVSGTSPSKGWAAVPTAAVQGGLVLLTRPDGIPAVTAAELDRLEPRRIVLAGGISQLGTAVARGAARHAPVVERVDGSGAAGASIALTRSAFRTAGHAWVVAADQPDLAVLAATAAAATRAPLLVVPADTDGLPAAHADLLRDLGVTKVTVVGPASGVAKKVTAALEEVVGDGTVRRATGTDRYAVAARVNALAHPAPTKGVAYVASGRAPTTAFAAASLAGLSKRPLYYTLPYCVPASVRPALVAKSVERAVLVGGEGTVRRLAGRLVGCLSIRDMNSEWVLVNRRNPLSPTDFAPNDLVVPPMRDTAGQRLRADAAEALARMSSAMTAQAGRVGIDTAFRSYATQDTLYDKWLGLRGRTWTDTWYARPGYSEHQTGLTVDLLPVGEPNCSVNDCIDETPQGAWLASNSWRHGFILRYEKGYRGTVGIGFEPWHFRYVGTELARAYHDGGWHTLEAFLDEPPAPSY